MTIMLSLYHDGIRAFGEDKRKTDFGRDAGMDENWIEGIIKTIIFLWPAHRYSGIIQFGRLGTVHIVMTNAVGIVNR